MKNASRRPLTARPPSAKAKPESKLGEHEQRLLHRLRGSFVGGVAGEERLFLPGRGAQTDRASKRQAATIEPPAAGDETPRVGRARSTASRAQSQ